MAIIRVIAIVVGEDTTTFYKEDGETIDLVSTDPRIPNMVALATPAIAAGLVASVDFAGENGYQKFEEKTGGLVKLFRVAKKFVQHIFEAPAKLEPQTIGTVPVVAAPVEAFNPLHASLEAPAVPAAPEPTELKPEAQAKADKFQSATDAILANAKSVTSENFTDDETKDDETIIAVVKDRATGKQVVIPGMEHLRDHMAIALKLGSTKGVEAFLQRISKVIDKRGHSINDLLNFMSKNDMPIADDGTFVAFKTLNRRGNHAGEYQDIHSGNVIQHVGSKVFMAEKMVDPNRHNECSNGLHVARRAYVGGFRGSHGVMCIIKVAPEDAIAVPARDGHKMRVCGYHIVADVPEDGKAQVYANKPIPKDSATGKLLGAIIRGDHIGVIEEVEIGGARGGNLSVTKLGSEAENSKALKEITERAKTAEPVASIDDSKDGATTAPKPIDTKGIAANVAATKKEAGQTKGQQARMLYTNGKLVELREFKKQAKKSWEVLGFAPEEIALITAPGTSPVTNGQPTSTPAATTKPEAKVPAESSPKKTPIAKNPTTLGASGSESSPTTKEPKMEGTRAEVARILFNQAAAGSKTRWGSLWRHQKECKKSWKVLGFSDKEIERIKTNKPDWV